MNPNPNSDPAAGGYPQYAQNGAGYGTHTPGTHGPGGYPSGSYPSGSYPQGGNGVAGTANADLAVKPLSMQPLSMQSSASGGGMGGGSAAHTAADSAFELLDVLKRQFWLIAMVSSIGIALATAYVLRAEVWYESQAKILVTQRNPQATQGYADGGTETAMDQDVLSNHIEIVYSSRVLDKALEKPGPTGKPLAEMPSIVARLNADEVASDFVREHLSVSKGGEGSASGANSLNIRFEHTNAADAKLVLESIVVEYQRFLDDQLRNASSQAATLVKETQEGIEQELLQAEEEYVEARRQAPGVWSGPESGNVYTDQLRTLETELIDITIQEANVATRLEKVKSALANIDASDGSDLQKMALIDKDSLERLGMFAALQINAANTVEARVVGSDVAASGRAEFGQLLELKVERARLTQDFGESYSGIRVIDQQIELIEKLLEAQDNEIQPLLEQSEITPEKLLEAYIGFLENDLAAFEDRKQGLKILSAEAEKNAKTLIEFELRDEQLRNAISRKQEMYEGIVDQLRNLDMAANFSGFVHELLDAPKDGEPSWPRIPMCLLGGAMLGGVLGALLAMATDRKDDRFRSSSEVERELQLKVLGRVGRLPDAGNGLISLAASASSPEGEAFRTVRTVLLPDIKAGVIRTLASTSALQGDGKSTTLANLAYSFSQTGLRVLVIDADMRRPTVHKQFGVKLSAGLADVLEGTISAKEGILKTKQDTLSVMTAGHNTAKPAELIQSAAFPELLENLKQAFDLVLVDIGPVLAVSDPVIAGQACDGVLLVTKVARDTKAQVRDAVARLRAGGANLLGCVINGFGAGSNFSSSDGYYGYYGGYGYGGKREEPSASKPGRRKRRKAASRG